MTRSEGALRARVLLTCSLLLGLALGCGGTRTPVPEGPVSTFVAPSRWLLQTSTGIWTPEGELVADLESDAPFPDLYLIDTSQEAFFVLSNRPGVHVARRTDAGFVVHRVREDARVERPMGQGAIVRFLEEHTRTALVDLDGTILVEGAYIRPAGGEDPPVDQPEYWWSLDYMTRPAPACSKDPQQCGWLTADGTWINPEPGTLGLATPMYMMPMATQDGITDGRSLTPWPTGRTRHAGPLSEGLVLVARDVIGPPYERSEVLRADGTVQAVITAEVAWDTVCAGPREDGSCQYVFHQGLASVVLTRQLGSAYLDTKGQVAIGPDACSARAPSGPFHEGRAFHCVGEEYWLIDREGARIAGPWPGWHADASDRNSYPSGLFFSEGLAAVPVEGGWAYVDTDGKLVLPGPYEVARPFRLGVATVAQAGRIGHINRDGASLFAR